GPPRRQSDFMFRKPPDCHRRDAATNPEKFRWRPWPPGDSTSSRSERFHVKRMESPGPPRRQSDFIRKILMAALATWRFNLFAIRTLSRQEDGIARTATTPV